MKIYLETYGCAANQSDSEIMLGLLSEDGFEIVDSTNDSDLNIINTCVVKSPTENRMKHRIKFLASLKKPLIIAGCMPKILIDWIEENSPEASVIGPDSIKKIVKVARKSLNEKIVFISDLNQQKVLVPKIRENSKIDIIQVSTGCLNNCKYCCVKFCRGRLRSYLPDLIIKQIEKGLEEGCNEFWLTSQDIGCYGIDIKSSLPELLKKVALVEGEFKVRVGMMNPTFVKKMVDDLVDSYRSDKIMKFLHIPIQSGSDKILKLMGRNYTVDNFEDIVKKFREKFPKITISTDVIVGFPGETEDDFLKTTELIKRVKPEVVNISKFGSRPKTEAAEMKELDKKIINKRSAEIHELIKNIRLENR